MKNHNRLKILRSIICVGLLVGIFFSFELWFPVERTFPRVPFVFESPIWFDRIMSVILITSLISTIFLHKTKVFLTTSLLSLFLLAFFDQIRLQPWVYQYFLLIVVMASADEDSDETLGLIQIIIAALYIWSGVQKLNYSFSHETLPALLETVFPEIKLPYLFIGISVAAIEILIGGGLLFRKTRNSAACAAVVMHAAVLGLLIAKNHNSIVWIWNAALILMIAAALWQSDGSSKQIFKKSADWKMKSAKSIVAASVLLPLLSFFGFWDMYLSGALYSGNVPVAVIRIDNELFEKLPPEAKQSVFQTETGKEKMLPLAEWATAALNVPVYPEQRVFKRVLSEVCKLKTNGNQVELIIKERPSISSGIYKITRIGCSESEGN